jgi:uncharacterized protein (TIGR00251 family)
MILNIKVTPKAKRTEYVDTMADGTLKIRLKAVPENGKANEELVAFLAKSIKIATHEIQLLSGHSSPRKRIQIPDSSLLPWSTQKNP